MVDRIMDSAAGLGAEELITACPLCLYNLNTSTSAEQASGSLFYRAAGRGTGSERGGAGIHEIQQD